MDDKINNIKRHNFHALFSGVVEQFLMTNYHKMNIYDCESNAKHRRFDNSGSYMRYS